MQLAPPTPSPDGRRGGRPRPARRRPSRRSTRALTAVMVALFVVGGAAVARPDLVDALPSLDVSVSGWDLGRAGLEGWGTDRGSIEHRSLEHRSVGR